MDDITAQHKDGIPGGLIYPNRIRGT